MQRKRATAMLLLAVIVTVQVRAAGAEERGFLYAARESTCGDVYAEPTRWKKLSIFSLFSEGWDEPWVSPPRGEGGAPRQGWLNAAEGVFYRLSIATATNADDFGNLGTRWTAGLTTFAPLSRRFQLQFDVPFLLSDHDSSGGRDTNFGDLQVTPRVILAEYQAATHSLNLTFRTPTGDEDNYSGWAAVTPNYQFWANWWEGLVVRGSVGMTIPYYNMGDVGARTSFVGNLAAGYYLTPHDFAPVGDLVPYVAANLVHATDNRGPTDPTIVTVTPGFRTHLGNNWYLLGAAEIPVTRPKPFDIQGLAGLMWVY